MNYYFLPKISTLKSTVTLVNFPPVENSSWGSQSAYVHATFSDGESWKVFFIQEIGPGDTLSLTMEDLPEHLPEGNSIFLFMYPKRLPEQLKTLPIDCFMDSEPNWRGNIQLSSPTTSVSFQGEYPGPMLNLCNARLLTFNPLIQDQPGVVTQLIVVVLLRVPEIKKGRLFIARQISGEIEKECSIRTNTCNLIDMAGLQDDSRNPLCLYSPDMLGIPIFFSHDPSYNFLSLEHSYPLHEVVVFGDGAKRGHFLKEIKSYWIKLLGQNVSS
jgi:hypothetical protein